MPIAPSHPPLDETLFAVFDVETTGFSPAHGDRVIEIAVCLVRGDGEWLDEYVTLVDPQRDPGPTYVHGIAAEDLAGAPVFADIAGDVAQMMDGAVLVGHNVSFDVRFLRAEFAAAGMPLPALDHVCTVSMARRLGKPAPRTLAACCHHFGVEQENAHSALDDVRATAGLLFRMIDQGAHPADVMKFTAPCDGAGDAWPRPAASGLAHVRAAFA